ncbi:MAG: sigma-54-dependent Fis family transcriptional regulator, partial [Gammaproteobacteria bacterium]|nr:sigma-54-dependent Fis family transcriptional regulator [Gammaproteobacteria bacterium]
MMNSPATIFFVDDDPKAGKLWLRFFRDTPYRCRVYQEPQEALEQYRTQGADLIITDLRMPGMSGTQLLKAIRGIDPLVPVILITAFADLESAIESLRLGATDFIKKPYDMNELLGLVDTALKPAQQPQKEGDIPPSPEDGLHYGMVGDSSAMRQVYRMIEKLAGVQCNIIIQGESGTGKELAARAIHNYGPRSQEPFVVIDCGSITDTLLESELFGHRRGAFTGADRERKGLLQAAGKGTVFLDEIGNISDAMQVKLLRVLQEGTFTPVGDNSIVSTQARFIAATNRDLPTLV